MQQQDEHNADTCTGDPEAALFDLYGKAIFAYLRLHKASREDAEDLAVEVFTAALENDQLSGVPEHERLLWLRRVAQRRLVDHYRRLQRRPVMVALSLNLETMLSDTARDPELIALQREAHSELHRAVSALPPLQQQILHLRFVDGLPGTEIAVLLNKREEAVRKLLSRTLAQLRAIFHATTEGRQ
jgi:RNA polymerase sigma factor (sigma-70 family)